MPPIFHTHYPSPEHPLLLNSSFRRTHCFAGTNTGIGIAVALKVKKLGTFFLALLLWLPIVGILVVAWSGMFRFICYLIGN